jgi:CheY-like chemotaxis protein
MKVLIVEDNMFRHNFFDVMYDGEEIHHAYTYKEACKFLDNNLYEIVQLDHDLGDFTKPDTEGGREMTGYDVARHLCEKNLVPDVVIVHSINPCGADSIVKLLNRNGVNVVRRPYQGDDKAYKEDS